MAGILACLEIFLDARARKQQYLAFTTRFQLFGRQLPFLVFFASCLMFLDLFFDRLAFPSSGHGCIL